MTREAGGKIFKTWAGQQSIMDIVSDLRGLLPPSELPPESWLQRTAVTECMPLNFDSDLGGAGADVDVGFSFDPLKSSGLLVAIRPPSNYSRSPVCNVSGPRP